MEKPYRFIYLNGYEENIDIDAPLFSPMLVETKALLDAAEGNNQGYLTEVIIEGVGVKQDLDDYVRYYYAPYLRKGKSNTYTYNYNEYTWELPEELKW